MIAKPESEPPVTASDTKAICTDNGVKGRRYNILQSVTLLNTTFSVILLGSKCLARFCIVVCGGDKGMRRYTYE